MKKLKQNEKSGQNFNWSFVIVCFLLAGAVLLNIVSSRSINLKKTSSQDLLVNKLCSNNSGNSGKVYDCGNYYVVTPSPLTSDLPNNVINKSGEVIAKCGGLMQFINDEERLKHTELCSQYTYTNCKVLDCQNKEENSALIKDNKYIYNSIELSYALKNGNNVVYITKNGVKKVLLDNVIYDAPGGSEPKFYKTDKANIALLESGLGDMGSIIKEYYYIDLLSERILSVVNNSTSMSVNGVKLSFGINDNCGTGADRVAGKAYLNNLLVDDSVKYTFNPEIQLSCVNPDGFGPIYESEPSFNFTSADLDLGKVYFSVSQSSFIFNISDRSITKDSSWSLYTNTKYGFEFQYPQEWKVEQDSDGSIYLTSNLPWPQEGKAFVIRETEKSLAKFIDDYNKSDILADGTALSTIFEQKDYYVAGVRADLLKGSTAIGVTSNIIFVTHNSSNYVIDFNDQSNNHLQILKSFKFIK